MNPGHCRQRAALSRDTASRLPSPAAPRPAAPSSPTLPVASPQFQAQRWRCLLRARSPSRLRVRFLNLPYHPSEGVICAPFPGTTLLFTIQFYLGPRPVRAMLRMGSPRHISHREETAHLQGLSRSLREFSGKQEEGSKGCFAEDRWHWV